MKRFTIFVLAVLMLLSVTGCGSKGPSTPDEVKGKVVDSGKFTVLVPDKWFSFFGSDLFDDYEEDYNPYVINLYFDAKSEWDALSRPGMMITYYDDDTQMWDPSPDFYENAETIDDITIGGRTYQAFTATSLNIPITVLWTKEPDQIQISMWMKNGNKEIKLDDVEVQAILQSIKIK